MFTDSPLRLTFSESCCIPELCVALHAQGQDGNSGRRGQHCRPTHGGRANWRTADERTPYQPDIRTYSEPNDCPKNKYTQGVYQLRNKTLRLNSDQIKQNNNTPCHVFFYIIGDVLIVIEGVLDFTFKNFFYWTLKFWLYVNSGAGSWAPNIPIGQQQQPNDTDRNQSKTLPVCDEHLQQKSK